MKFNSKLLIVVALVSALVGPAFGQNAPVQTQPLPRLSSDASSTITVTDTFQTIWAQQNGPVGSAAIRNGCSVQNNGTHTMWVYAGQTTPSKGASIVLPPGAVYSCAVSGTVTTSLIAITGTAADAFTALVDGAPSISGGGAGGGGVPVDVVITDPVDAFDHVQTVLYDSSGNALTYNANGQATMANSSPVVIASNQSAIDVGLGTAGTADSSVVTVQGIASMTPVQVSQATASNLKAQVTGAGTAGTADTGVQTIQGIASMTPVQTVQSNQYPNGATPYTASATGTTAATTATLTGASSVTTYICGFSIRANATAAATGNATVTGTITGTLNFTQWTAPLASGLGIVEMIFTPCVPASATNTSIAVVSAAPGSGGVVSVSAWGYKL